MVNGLITHLQIFGIGLGFGIAGPCFFSCAPILITYSIGNRPGVATRMRDVIVFLTGRLSAYIILGAAAGLSAGALKKITGPHTTSLLGLLAGSISVMMGVSMLLRHNNTVRSCGHPGHKVVGRGGLFLAGFALGLAPCAPLGALLFDIAVMSKTALEGAAYALSFGLGTFASGLLIVGAVIAGLGSAADRLIKSDRARSAFAAACALLLVAIGIGLVLGGQRL